MRTAGRFLGSLALALATLLLCAAIGELVLRMTSPYRSAGEHQRLNVYRTSGKLNHELRPGWQGRFALNGFDVAIRVDALGFRGPEVAAAKEPGRKRILVVGDSFAFGWGVEEDEMFSRVLEDRLEEAGVPAEVISAGVPGYATDQHWIFLRERGLALEPDLVLLAICGNDTEELAWTDLELDERRLPVASVSRRRFVNRRGEMRFLNHSLFDLPGPPIPERMRSWLVDHSWAYGWLRIRLARAWARGMERVVSSSESLADDEVPTGPIATLSPDEIDRGLRGNEAFRLRYHRYLIEAIEREVASRGAALRLLVLESTEAGIREDCRRSRCLDQGDLFTQQDDPASYLPDDGHWSARGHRKVGEALAAWLLEDRDLALRAR